MPDLNDLCDDLAEEQASLDEMLEPLDAQEWFLDTPAVGWTLRDQVAHLYFGDNRARLAAADPAAFKALRDHEYGDKERFAAVMTTPELGLDGRSVYEAWLRERVALIETYRNVDPKVRIEWYGPPMSPASKISARIMETWAHGQDILDTLGATRTPTARLRHVAHIGVGARRFSYVANQQPVDDTAVYVELVAPSGEHWTWGDPVAVDANAVQGAALDFCLVVTQRRHIADTTLNVRGEAALAWLSIAQAFAGPPGAGRLPGQFSTDQSREHH